MLNRNVVLLFSLFIVLVEGDIDSSDAGIHSTSTDKDSTSDEAPTESINAISPDHPDESHYYGGGPSDVSSSSSQAADISAVPEPAVAAPNSVEEEDDDSEELGKKKSSSSLANLNHQSPDHAIESPALPPQPVIPQPKTLVRSRTSKRRSRNNRRQI